LKIDDVLDLADDIKAKLEADTYPKSKLIGYRISHIETLVTLKKLLKLNRSVLSVHGDSLYAFVHALYSYALVLCLSY